MHPFTRPAPWTLLALLAACAAPADRPHVISETRVDAPLEGRPRLGMPIGLPGQTTELVPFVVERPVGVFDDRDPFDQGGRGTAFPRAAQHGAEGFFLGHALPPGYPGGPVRWHNAVVHDPEARASWALLDRRAVISRWQAFGNPVERNGPRPETLGLLFLATLEDTNADGVLDDRDARALLLTDGAGREPRIVTPADAQVWSVRWDPERGRLYLLVAHDADDDGRFTEADRAVPYGMYLHEEVARPLVAPDLEERLRALLE